MFWRQFTFVVKKNLLVKSRHPGDLLLEFLVPVAVIIGLWSIRLAISEKITKEYIPDEPLHVSTLDDLFRYPSCRAENLIWNCATLEDTDCDVFDYESHSWEGCLMKKIAVAPASGSDAAQAQAAKDFIAFVNSSLELTVNVSLFTYFDSEGSFQRYIKQSDYSRDTDSIQVYSAAVIFNSAGPQWDYTVRLNKTMAEVYGDSVEALNTPSTEESTNILLKSADEWPDSTGVFESAPYLDAYHSSGLFSLTNYLTSFVATSTCRNVGLCSAAEEVTVRTFGLVHFPNREIKEDSFWSSLGGSFALLMILALLYPISNVIKSLVSEKESRLKEGMLMMSLESSVLAASWVFHFALIFLPLAGVLTLAGQGLFLYSDNIFIFLYYVAFFSSSMAYSFLVSTLFSRAKSASILGTFAFFMGYFVYIGLEGSAEVSRSELLMACLHPAAAFTYGTLGFMEYEDARVGITADTWTTSSQYEISFADTLLMQLVNSLYMGFLAWYLGQVWHSEFGLSKPWYFLFLPSYWRALVGCDDGTGFLKVHSKIEGEGGGAGEVEMVSGTGRGGGGEADVPVEEVPANLHAQVTSSECVHLDGLQKVFSTNTGKKRAVDGLGLTFYSGQITALLGHNGAGKSTVVNMLSGLYPPDAGSASIMGHDISQEMHEARKLLGVCPQHDVLLPELTVAEHLEFFAGIKGCPPEEIAGEVERLVKSVGLTEKRNVQSRFLSGGQKRKLSVGIAFIGNSKVVILDEPTSGMDPYSRRFTWNVIRQHREGRVIILVTHFMDEADLLGDRIAIMGDGKLRCCGSSLFLKKKFGVGYNMTVEKTSVVDFSTPAVLENIHRAVPDATILTDVGTELTVQLPFASARHFESLFGSIDENMGALHVASYGMSVTTMEEVFLKVAAGTFTINRQEVGAASTGAATDAAMDAAGAVVCEGEGEVLGAGDNATEERETRDEESIQAVSSPSKQHDGLFIRHMRSLLHKRVLYFSRDTKSWLYQYILPVLFVLIGAIIMSIQDFSPPQDSLTLSPAIYNQKISTNNYPLPYGSEVCYDESQCPALYPHELAMELMAHMPESANLPIEFTNVSEYSNVSRSLGGMSRFLLDHRTDHQASRYGAVSFHDLQTNKSAINNGSLSSVSYSVHGNFSGVHSCPVTVQLVAEAVVLSFDPSASVTMRLHPLPETEKQKDTFNQWSVTNLVIFLALAIAFVPAGMASFVVYEKETKCRHQQMVSGVSIEAYWLSTWLWDSVSYQVTAWLMLLIILCFKDTAPLTSTEAFPVTIGLLMLYGPAVAGAVYIFSRLLTSSSSSQIVVIFAMFVQGLVFGIMALVLRVIPSTRDVYMNVIRNILMIFPPFAVVEGLNNLAVMEQHAAAELGGGRTYSPGDMKVAGLNLWVLGVEAAVLIIVQIVLDYALLKPQLLSTLLRTLHLSPPPPASSESEGRDEDVLAEDRDVAAGVISPDNCTVLLRDITKTYPGGKRAVRGVSLGVPLGQCFGLLGVNGAGKSSLLNMLSGEFPPSSGDAFIAGMSLITSVDKCRREIGFCPQFDALYDLLTGREHLRLYAAVKGIAAAEVEGVVEAKLRELGLGEYADRATGGYSGGNKRKLSVAMALIGDPSIVFLDEPSTGMDPMARRFMWRVISDAVMRPRKEQCSVILTTHSMEECEALCSRVGIMVDGVMRCLGSSQRLRSLYGLGFQMEILLKVPEDEAVAAGVAELVAALNGDGKASGEMSKSQMERALGGVGAGEWVSRVSEHGSGSDLHSSLLHYGFVTAPHLASWLVLERRYEALFGFLGNHFDGFRMRERQLARVRVEVPLLLEGGSRRKLSRMFGLIEENSAELSIMEYSISQTSLEQIFNSFAMKQTGEVLM